MSVNNPHPQPDYSTFALRELGVFILRDWQKVYFAAVPYLQAILESGPAGINGYFYADDYRGIVLRFLANAGSWKGETAKAIKAELKRRATGK